MLNNVIIFVGAGISKEKPSNLLSWWDYNKLLIDEIGNIGAEVINQNKSLLNAEDVLKKIPISTISEYISNYYAGKTYFSILKILEGSYPNRNHALLCRLAANNMISGIITTNFDTLIEQAFKANNVPYQVYMSDVDFADYRPCSTNFPIYKIHGSIVDTTSCIDTVQQKIKGLTNSKRNLLKDLFSKNHVIFIGFSGEDMAFGSDYLPLSNATEGITWVLNPKCKTDKIKWIDDPQNEEQLVIHVRKTLKYIKMFRLCSATISQFCSYMNWPFYDCNDTDKDNNIDIIDARQTIRNFLLGDSVTKWNCLGMSIELIKVIDGLEVAYEIVVHVKDFLDNYLKEYMNKNGNENTIILPLFFRNIPDFDIDSPSRNFLFAHQMLMPLYDTMAAIFGEHGDFKKALDCYYLSTCISEICMCFHIFNDPEGIDVSYNNLATTEMRTGMLLKNIGMPKAAASFLAKAMEDAMSAARFYDISAAFYLRTIFELGRFFENDDYGYTSFKTYSDKIEKIYSDLWCGIRLAKKGGNADVLFSSYGQMANFLIFLERYSDAMLAINMAESYKNIIYTKEVASNNIRFLYERIPTHTKPSKSFLKDIQYLEPSYCTDWEECRERNILSEPEGREAYNYFCKGSSDKALDILKDTHEKYWSAYQENISDESKLYLAEMFSYASMRLTIVNNNEFNELYASRCLSSEIILWETDYMAETTALISFWHFNMDRYKQALFYAEFCLCMCDDPLFHGIIVAISAVAALCCIELGKKATALYYIDMFIAYRKIMPQTEIDSSTESKLLTWRMMCKSEDISQN